MTTTDAPVPWKGADVCFAARSADRLADVVDAGAHGQVVIDLVTSPARIQSITEVPRLNHVRGVLLTRL